MERRLTVGRQKVDMEDIVDCYVTAGTFTRRGFSLDYDKALRWVKGSELESRRATSELLVTSDNPQAELGEYLERID
jgi:hypothetical protein